MKSHDVLRCYVRQALKEVKMSPSFGKQKALDDPFDDDRIRGSIETLKRDYGFALGRSMYVKDFDKHYDKDSREFDDDRAQHIKSTVQSAENQIDADVERVLMRIWQRAMGKGGTNPTTIAPPQRSRKVA